MHTVVDMTMLQIDISGDPPDDEPEHDRVRARQVVEYICDRFPPVRDDGAPDPIQESAKETVRRSDEAFVPPRKRCPKSCAT